MKMTVLVDNNTLIDHYLLGEPGLSLLFEDGGKKILFDAGYSGAFLENARRLGLSLRDIDDLVLSHGHLDHVWGLNALTMHFAELACEGESLNKPRLTAHPYVFDPKTADDVPQIGMSLSRSYLEGFFEIALTDKPRALTENLYYLGEIPRRFDFEPFHHRATRLGPDGPEPDRLADDTALCARTEKGLAVFCGCAHSGVCNTVEHAREVMGEERVSVVFGGFHLQNAKPARLEAVGEYLGALGLDALYPCHCVDLSGKIALARTCPVKEARSGMTLVL